MTMGKIEPKEILYIGQRIREIRQVHLMLTQLQIVKELNLHYQEELFSQARIHQIEVLGSTGKLTIYYISYLCELGYDATWIIKPSNEGLNPKADESFQENSTKSFVKEIRVASKMSATLTEQLNTFKTHLEQLSKS